MDNRESTYPSTFATSKKKGSYAYLLDYVQHMHKEKENGQRAYSFEEDSKRFKTNRRWAEGRQSIEPFKSRLSSSGDDTYLNIDWKVTTPLKKIVQILVGKLTNLPFKSDFKPVDRTSITEIDKERKIALAKIKMKKAFSGMEEEGIVQIDTTGLPDHEEELDIYWDTQFKSSQSMAMEVLVKAIMDDNDWEKTCGRIANDLVKNNAMWVKVELDDNMNIKIRYCDPVNMSTSYVIDPEFYDVKHVGEYIYPTIDDLRVQAPELREADLFEIAKASAGKNGNGKHPFDNDSYYENNINPKDYGRFLVKVLDFEMFSTDTLVGLKKKNKENGKEYYEKKSESYEIPEGESKYDRKINKTRVKNVYCGKWIVNTKYLYDYGKKKNMIRARVNGNTSTNTSLGYLGVMPDIYDMKNKSMVEEAIPFAKQLILVQLKIQQVLATAKPAGYAINVDAMIGALEAMGVKGMKPIDARSITDQIGDIYYSTRLEDGSQIQGTPITPLPNGLDQSLAILAQEYNNALSRMKEVLGLNDAVDGSQPDKRTAVGVQQISMVAHENAYRTMYDYYLRLQERVSRYVAILAQQLIRKGHNVKKFENWIGAAGVKNIEMGKLPFYEYAITVKMLPDARELAEIDKQLDLSRQEGKITAEDVYLIRRVAKEDPEKAEMLMGKREARRSREQEEMKAAAAKQNAEVQAYAGISVEKEKQKTMVIKGNEDRKTLELEYDLKNILERTKGQEKRKTIPIETDGKIEIIEAANMMDDGQDPESFAGLRGNGPSQSPEGPTPGGHDLKNDSLPPGVEPRLGITNPGRVSP